MASGLVINIEVGADKHTEVLNEPRIRIGTTPECELRLHESIVTGASGILLELTRTSLGYRVTDFNQALPLTINNRPLELNHLIADANEIGVPSAQLVLRFFPVQALPASVERRHTERREGRMVAQFAESAALESAATSRRDDAKVFLREFTRELVREISPWTKLTVLLILSALVGGVLYLGAGVYRESQRTRRLNDQQNEQITLLQELIQRTNKQISEVTESNQGIIYSMSLAPKMWSDYNKGVCLIAGSYAYFEAAPASAGGGRPLRYPPNSPTPESTTAADATAATPSENPESPPLLTPEGNGEIAEYYFIGTGFHTGSGYVLTNRHVVQPWTADERAETLSATVRGRPRLIKLLAYFPGRRQPVPLKFKIASATDDIAVCTLESDEAARTIPTLPLERDQETARIGTAVVMMGYPSGPDRLLAMLPENESRLVQQRYQTLEELLGYFAEGTGIAPLTTQGSITALNGRRVVYDARTAEGGSGAPVFGQSGRVIGVNFGVFTENDASNLAVPIRYAVRLLQRAGWEPKDPLEGAQNANANQAARDISPAAAAGGAATTNQTRQTGRE